MISVHYSSYGITMKIQIQMYTNLHFKNITFLIVKNDDLKDRLKQFKQRSSETIKTSHV